MCFTGVGKLKLFKLISQLKLLCDQFRCKRSRRWAGLWHVLTARSVVLSTGLWDEKKTGFGVSDSSEMKQWQINRRLLPVSPGAEEVKRLQC